MNQPVPKLLTPILLKTTQELSWPENESVFHLLTASGLFLCRNHPFFASSVPVSEWPQELAEHAPFLQLRYPRLPRRLLEQLVGFFAILGETFGAEAAALLAWDPEQRRVEVIVPRQCSLVSYSLDGRGLPLSVEYDVPSLPKHWTWIGDVHSHVDEPAFASATDVRDERHRPGLHIVVGRIFHEPPDFHIEATVDGMRFQVTHPELVLEGYERRRIAAVPPTWIDQVEVRH